MPEHVRITDVSPRDGLQNEPGVIATESKVKLITNLLGCGVDEVEFTSFVSPKWVPQLGDCAQVCDAIAAMGRSRVESGPILSALVPNEKGMQGALDANQRAGFALLRKVSVFTAASETFAQKNTNATIAQTIERFVPVVNAVHANGLLVRGYVSCVIACPFEGAIAPSRVVDVVKQLVAIGVDEIDLGDTIGAGTPETVRAMLETVASVHEFIQASCPVTLHLHDTFGAAASCVVEALKLGVRSFDGSVAGLGGCPYASTPGKRAPGNIASELLVRTVRDAGFVTGVDEVKLAAAGAYAAGLGAR